MRGSRVGIRGDEEKQRRYGDRKDDVKIRVRKLETRDKAKRRVLGTQKVSGNEENKLNKKWD